MSLQHLPLAHFYEGRILNFAHRGARAAAPENTVEAFLLAADLGADGVELDVQLCADGVPVVIHDLSVDATTDGTGRVAALTLAELRALDAGSRFSADFTGARIPTLDEVFEAVGRRLLINVEIKTASFTDAGERQALAEAVAAVIARHELGNRVLVSSFNPFALRAMRRVAADLPLGYLYAPDLPLPLAKGWLARPVIGRYEAVHPHFSMVDVEYLRRARRQRRRVNVWTVNELDDIRRMLGLGVDMIISDRPDLVQDVLQGER